MSYGRIYSIHRQHADFFRVISYQEIWPPDPVLAEFIILPLPVFQCITGSGLGTFLLCAWMHAHIA